MTVRGALTKTLALFVVLLAGGVLGWSWVDVNPRGGYDTPGWLWLVSLLTFFLGVMTATNPDRAKVFGPVYALAEGTVLGGLSHVYESAWNGIVAQAVLVTTLITLASVLGVLIGFVKPSAKLQAAVAAGLFGVILLYLVAFFFGIFGVEFSFLYDSSGLGVVFSLLLIVLAALSVIGDVGMIVQAAEMGAPKELEWYGAWGLMVSVIWLYLEVLRLLARFGSRQ